MMTKATDRLAKLEAEVKAERLKRDKSAEAAVAKVERWAKSHLASFVKAMIGTPVTFRPATDDAPASFHIVGTGGTSTKSPSPIKAWGAIDIEVTTGTGKTRKTRRLGHTQVSKVLMLVGIDYGKNSPIREAMKPLVEPKLAAIHPMLIGKDGKRASLIDVLKADA